MQTQMNPTERRAIVSLSTIMGLRMIGLFMVLPVFSLYASGLTSATPALIGVAMGVYGLSQALFQIPFGFLSDRYGRKRLILLGLIIFAVGSLISGLSHSIYLMIFGRALQGIGAVGSTILAMMADLTSEEHRSKAMAITGMTIGLSFSLAMLIGPMLTQWLPVNNLFFLAALFGMLAILILYAYVPNPAVTRWHRDTEPELKSFLRLLKSPELAKLNIGIFILHAIFTASFIVIPISLKQTLGLISSQQWHFYLPALMIAFIASLFCIGIAERKQKVKPYFISGIATLALAEILLWLSHSSIFILLSLSLFFAGFSLLEAFLPSLVSRTAPAARKGSAMGIYSSAQFLGIFAGGICGGWLFGRFSFSGVYLFSFSLALVWLIIAFLMQAPRFLVTQMLRVRSSDWDSLALKLQVIPGLVEAVYVPEDGIAYLKMERETVKHPEYVQLKELMQE